VKRLTIAVEIAYPEGAEAQAYLLAKRIADAIESFIDERVALTPEICGVRLKVSGRERAWPPQRYPSSGSSA